MPKVSVLMPVYKTDENYLREAIESILSQTFEDFEFLILDDCPEDDREEIVKSYNDDRIKYSKNEKNLGISASRNKLIDMAQGEYLAVMDHDDICLPDRFKKQVGFLDMHPDIGVCGSSFSWVHKNKITKKPETSDSIERALLCGCAIHHPSAIIRKSVLKASKVNYEAAFSPAEDYALWCRLIGKTKFYNIQEPLLLYRKHETQTSVIRKNAMKQATAEIHDFVRRKHPALWNEVCREIPSIVRVKLFGFLPILKFYHRGFKYDGFLKYIPFLSIKTKMGAIK